MAIIRSLSTGGIKGTYNAISGLENFRRSLGMTVKNSQGVGAGGIDIICYGDSILEGYNSSEVVFDSAVHLLKVKLQEYYNPSGVVGGYGFLSAKRGGGGTYWTDFGTGIGDEGNPYSIAAKSRGGNGGVGATGGSYINLNGTDAAWKKLASDAVQFVGIRGFAYGTTRWDIGVGAKPNIGSGSQTGTHSQYSNTGVHGNQTNGGNRYGLTGESSFTSKIDLTPSANNFVQWALPTINNPIGDAKGAYEGVIAYNGDFTSGVRVHNCSYHGKALAGGGPFLGYVTDRMGGSDVASQGSFVTWGQGLKTGGSCNAKLYIMDWITNDCGTGATPNQTVAQFTARYSEALDYILTLPSKPSILLVIPHKRDDADLAARTTDKWEDYRDAIINLANARANVAVLDLNAYFDNNGNLPTGIVADSGWYVDGVHYSDAGQAAWAEIMFKMLTS